MFEPEHLLWVLCCIILPLTPCSIGNVTLSVERLRQSIGLSLNLVGVTRLHVLKIDIIAYQARAYVYCMGSGYGWWACLVDVDAITNTQLKRLCLSV